MLKTPTDAIKLPAGIARELGFQNLSGYLGWVTPRQLAGLAKKPFRLLRRGWKLSTEPLGYLIGSRQNGQFLRFDGPTGHVILDSYTADCWHRITITRQGELLYAGPAYEDGRDELAA